eukprot:1044084-Amphidinium_carterae.1
MLQWGQSPDGSVVCLNGVFQDGADDQCLSGRMTTSLLTPCSRKYGGNLARCIGFGSKFTVENRLHNNLTINHVLFLSVPLGQRQEKS